MKGDQKVLLPQFSLTVGGISMPAAEMTELMRDVIEVVVDDTLHLPDMFTIHLSDKQLKWVDSDLLAIGAKVEISAKPAEGQNEDAPEKNLLMKGEITALEPDFSKEGEPTLLVRGYDRSHRLHRGKQTRSFVKMTDSDIVGKIAAEIGLKAQSDPTSPPYDYVLQNNQTNLEFLLERARRIGYQLYVEDETLHFCKADTNEGQGPELKWGHNLLDFKPRLSVAHQANEVIVRGWDPKAKREIVGRATQGKLKPEVGLSESGGDLAQQAFKEEAQAVVVTYPVANQDEAQAMAQALCNHISSQFIQAEGVCLGNSGLNAGKTVQIAGVGERFSGSYFVTRAIHTHSSEIGYETTFNISARHTNTLSDLLGQQTAPGRNNGVVIGLVTNNKDPDGLGRVKVKFPWLSDDEESAWARIASPMAGQERGFFYLPEINDEVLLSFEHGDIHYPYILGTLWNGKDKPPEKQDKAVGGDGKVNLRMLKSRSGHQVLLDDSSGQEQIVIKDSSGQDSLTFNAVENVITLKAEVKVVVQAGGQMVTLDNQSKAVEIKGGGRTIALRNGQMQIN